MTTNHAAVALASVIAVGGAPGLAAACQRLEIGRIELEICGALSGRLAYAAYGQGKRLAEGEFQQADPPVPDAGGDSLEAELFVVSGSLVDHLGIKAHEAFRYQVRVLAEPGADGAPSFGHVGDVVYEECKWDYDHDVYCIHQNFHRLSSSCWQACSPWQPAGRYGG